MNAPQLHKELKMRNHIQSNSMLFGNLMYRMNHLRNAYHILQILKKLPRKNLYIKPPVFPISAQTSRRNRPVANSFIQRVYDKKCGAHLSGKSVYRPCIGVCEYPAVFGVRSPGRLCFAAYLKYTYGTRLPISCINYIIY